MKKCFFLMVIALALCSSASAGDTLATLNGQWRVDADATALDDYPQEEGTERELVRSRWNPLLWRSW